MPDRSRPRYGDVGRIQRHADRPWQRHRCQAHHGRDPKRGEFIRRLTGWEQVEPGTLTLDHAVPLPLPALRDVSPLGEESDDLLLNLNASDAQIATKRGSPKYYGAVASARSGRRRVVLSQQPRPAVGHRLEIIGDVFLRTALQVVTGDIIHIEIFNADDWRQLPTDLI
jgi:hypothetical protein